MSAFIYKDPKDLTQLHQGDILNSTPHIKEILEMSYPSFPGKEYTHFMVLTQSCDLVIREEAASAAPYISLAAICDFDKFLEQTFATYQNHPIEKKGRLLSESFYGTATNLLERLFNNNEDDCFYLPEDVQNDFPESVALLRLTVTIESQPHYKECMAARVLELNDTFKAKLGWIVGKIYSRVGTEDWTTKEMSREEFANWIRKVLTNNFMWLEKKTLKTLKKQYTENEVDLLKWEEIQAEAEKIKPPSKRDELVEIVRDKLQKSGVTDEKTIRKIITSIKNDPSLSTIVK